MDRALIEPLESLDFPVIQERTGSDLEDFSITDTLSLTLEEESSKDEFVLPSRRSLKSLPEEERPRERLLRDGVDALSHAELIAIVLGSGTQGKSVLELAKEMLELFGGLEKLLDASVVELMEIKGIGLTKAIQLKAVFGIALKCRKPVYSSKFAITSARNAYELAQGEIAHLSQEVLLVILRDVRGNLLHIEWVSMGTLSQVLVHPREVFYPAVRYKAHSLIIAHNHPSGDPTPSKSDFELTRNLFEAGRVMSIGFDDHLIVCRDRYVSMREMGFLPLASNARY
jgi:DNA repair protein RadC